MIEWEKDNNDNLLEYIREDGRIENRGRDGDIEYKKVDNIIIGLLIENNTLPQDRIDKVFNYTSLEELRLVNCNITELSSKISKLSKLKILNLENNKLEEVPSTIGTLSNLEELNLSQNSIKKLPNQFEKLQNLINLNLSKNKEIEINESLFKFRRLEFLNLGFTNVEKVVDRINEFSYLKELSLSGNEIDEISESLVTLEKLEKLWLDNNLIKEIPENIELLKSLKVLDLRFNEIEKISKRIMNLNLNELFLKNNPFLIFEELSSVNWKQSLTELFNIHEDYQEFKKIDLSDLGLTYIPDLSYFKDIEVLDLSRNKIEDILEKEKDDDGIFYIKENIYKVTESLQLKELNLSSNNISEIPKELLTLTNLAKLNLEYNPVSQIKGFTLNESPKEIIEFLLLNQEKELVALNEAKLLVVGDENAGKSSLVERMVKNQFNLQYNSTQGIDISHYPLSSDIIRSYCFDSYVEPNIKVNIWDFAGQEITYQVHNLFMSKESLYLLVIDGQKEDNIVENFDWLESISANADNPPVIIVITKHENNRSHEIDEARYREEFPNIEAIHYVSAKENIGFCELKQSVLLSISRFGKQKIPSDYEEVKNKIEEKKTEKLKQEKYMLSADDFDDICEKSNLFEERDNIRTIFNDIGVLIGLNNDDMHVVNPSKMIDKIYKIIRSKEIADNGELDVKKDNDRHYTWIMQFLLKNKIAFELDDSKVMIPSRLSVKRPERFSKSSYMREDKVYGLNFRYRYKRFKKGIFFDFLIQVLNVDEIKPTYWANGITLNFDEFKVAVLASKVDRTIDIHISKESEESKIFLTKIRKILERINREHRGVIEEIGVVDEFDDTLYYKSYRFLKEKEKKNKRTKSSDVELDIRGNPKDFSLLPLLEKYEFVEEEFVDDGVNPLIITEGKTDWKHLKKALERFQNDGFYQDLNIQFEEYEDTDMGDAELDRMVQTYCKTKQSRKHIFMFDRDNNTYVKKYAKQEFNNHGNNVYSFCIPKISDELDKICIEFYYKKEDLTTKDKQGKRIFIGEDFLENGNSKCKQYVTAKRNPKELDILDRDKKVYLRDDIEWKDNIALSKNDFTNNIINDVKDFDNFDIEYFKLIFDVIEKIINED